ncbi:MAG TPA: ABC transporter permease [Vicinamibacterales bacterium]|nr:ABC transporter permease [Vicinamibacterales bacterium]
MKDRDADLRAEIEAHLKLAIADRVARGEDPREAAAAARRELGNVGQIQEADRELRGGRWLEYLGQDARYALRIFRRNPGFAAVAILSLALGVGANTALFQVVDAVRLRALPVADPQHLYQVRLADMDGARGNFETWRPAVTYPIWRAIEARQQAFSTLFAWGTDDFSLTTGGELRSVKGLWVSGGFFGGLGLKPAAGRLLAADDDRPGCAPRAVLSDAYWRRAYGGSPSAVGQTITLGSRPVEIVGVAPEGFLGLEVGRSFDVALPLCSEPVFSDDGRGRLQAGTSWWITMFGRLAPGWTIARANAHLAAVSPELFKSTLPANYPVVSAPKYLKFQLAAYPGGEGLSQLREDYTSPLWLMLGIAGLVLLIACANLANLLLARATSRQREIAVRMGLGASRGRVIRQLLTESLLLAVIGGLCGALLAQLLSASVVALLDTDSSTTSLALGFDWRVLGFTAGLSLLTCLLFGLAPAVNATRVGASSVMRATSRGATSSRDAVGLRRVLVIAQIALSVTLLFGSLLFARSLYKIVTIDPGFKPDGVVAAAVVFRKLELPAEQRDAFRRRLLERIRALPGVESVATVRIIPVSGSSSGNAVWPEGNKARSFNTSLNDVGPGFFSTMRIPFVAGRDFDDRDRPESTPVVIVNEAFAARFTDGGPVVGMRFTREATPGGPEKSFEVVGVVKNSTYADLKEGVLPVAFLADTQSPAPGYMRTVIRTSLPTATVTAGMTRALGEIDPRIGVAYRLLTTQLRDAVVGDRMLATLSGGFGVLAAILTLVGLYGLIAYTVTRRTNEIGVRMALGAGRAAIARLILRETTLLLAVGATIGIALALAGGRAAASLLFGVKPTDPIALLSALAFLACIALAASYAPARRATRIEPVVALRID